VSTDSFAASEDRPLSFLPLLAASVLATTAGFTFSSFVMAELQGTFALTRHDARLLDLLVLAPLASLPVLLLVCRASGYAVSSAFATLALFVGHLIAYLVRSYIDGVINSTSFPSDDERSAVITYGYLGWLVGPLVTTALLLLLDRVWRDRDPASLTREAVADRSLSEPSRPRTRGHGASRIAWLLVAVGSAAWLWIEAGAIWGVVLGLTVAIVLVWTQWRSVADENNQSRPHAAMGGDLMWIGFGAGITLAGVLKGDLAFALMGLPLVAVGFLWSSMRRSVPPRS
jgi:hypothetical protein